MSAFGGTMSGRMLAEADAVGQLRSLVASGEVSDVVRAEVERDGISKVVARMRADAARCDAANAGVLVAVEAHAAAAGIRPAKVAKVAAPVMPGQKARVSARPGIGPEVRIVTVAPLTDPLRATVEKVQKAAAKVGAVVRVPVLDIGERPRVIGTFADPARQKAEVEKVSAEAAAWDAARDAADADAYAWQREAPRYSRPTGTVPAKVAKVAASKAKVTPRPAPAKVAPVPAVVERVEPVPAAVAVAERADDCAQCGAVCVCAEVELSRQATPGLAAYLDRLVYGPKKEYAAAWAAHVVFGAPSPADPGTPWAPKVRAKVERWSR